MDGQRGLTQRTHEDTEKKISDVGFIFLCVLSVEMNLPPHSTVIRPAADVKKLF